MSDDSGFSFDSESDDPVVTKVVAAAVQPSSTPAVVRVVEDPNDDFDIGESFEASPQDSLPLPKVSPQKTREVAKAGAKAKKSSLLSPKTKANQMTYDVDALFSPMPTISWKAALSVEASANKPEAKPKKPDTAYADVLYSKKASVEAKIDKLREVKQSEEESKCTFTPTVNPHGIQKRDFDSFLNEQKHKGEERDKKVLKLKADIEAQTQDKEVTFKPQISHKSAQITATRALPAHESLHSSARSALKRSIDQHLKEVTATAEQVSRHIPSINRSSGKLSKNEPVQESIKEPQPKQGKGHSARPVSGKVSKASDKVLVDKLTREFNEAFDLLVEEGANYLQVRAILQRLQFLSPNPSVLREQQEREQLSGLWHELDPEQTGEVSRAHLLDLLLKVHSPLTKPGKAYSLLHDNRRDAKRLKPTEAPRAASAVVQSVEGKRLADKLIQEGKEWKEARLSQQSKREQETLQGITFKPTVNPVRRKKAEVTLELATGLSRTELLFQMSKKLHQERESKIKSRQEQQERLETKACLAVPDLSLTSKALKMTSIPVAGEDKAVERLRKAQMGSEWKKLVLEKGLANIKRLPSSAQGDKTLSQVAAAITLDLTSSFSPTHQAAKAPATSGLRPRAAPEVKASLVSSLNPSLPVKSASASAPKPISGSKVHAKSPLKSSLSSKLSPKDLARAGDSKPVTSTQKVDVKSPLKSKPSPQKQALSPSKPVKQSPPKLSSATEEAEPQVTEIYSEVVEAPPHDLVEDLASSEGKLSELKEISNEDEPLLTITVNLSADESDQLVLYNEEDLERVVEDFVRKHNLPESKRSTLEQMVRDYLEECNPVEEGEDAEYYQTQLEEVAEVSTEALECSEVKEAELYEESEEASPGLDHVDEVSEEHEGQESGKQTPQTERDIEVQRSEEPSVTSSEGRAAAYGEDRSEIVSIEQRTEDVTFEQAGVDLSQHSGSIPELTETGLDTGRDAEELKEPAPRHETPEEIEQASGELGETQELARESELHVAEAPSEVSQEVAWESDLPVAEPPSEVSLEVQSRGVLREELVLTGEELAVEASNESVHEALQKSIELGVEAGVDEIAVNAEEAKAVWTEGLDTDQHSIIEPGSVSIPLESEESLAKPLAAQAEEAAIAEETKEPSPVEAEAKATEQIDLLGLDNAQVGSTTEPDSQEVKSAEHLEALEVQVEAQIQQDAQDSSQASSGDAELSLRESQ
jgi:hypothetical protein